MSYAGAIAGLTALPVAGVKKQQSRQPAQINGAELPLLFPSLPRGEQRVITLEGGMELPSYRVNLVLVVEAVQQGRTEPTWELCVALMDAQAAALEGATLTAGVVGYTMQLNVNSFGAGENATAYWTILTEVEVQ